MRKKVIAALVFALICLCVGVIGNTWAWYNQNRQEKGVIKLSGMEGQLDFAFTDSAVRMIPSAIITCEAENRLANTGNMGFAFEINYSWDTALLADFILPADTVSQYSLIRQPAAWDGQAGAYSVKYYGVLSAGSPALVLGNPSLVFGSLADGSSGDAVEVRATYRACPLNRQAVAELFSIGDSQVNAQLMQQIGEAEE